MNIYVFDRRSKEDFGGRLDGAVVVAKTREDARKAIVAEHASVSTKALEEEFDVQLLSRYSGYQHRDAFVVLASYEGE